MTHYETLGIKQNASADEVKSAYRKKALQYHPDKHPEDRPGFEEFFKTINIAYSILSDPLKRSAYNRTLQPVQPKQQTQPVSKRPNAGSYTVWGRRTPSNFGATGTAGVSFDGGTINIRFY